MVDKHKKKMVAPILITIIFVIYYMIYFGFLLLALNGILAALFGIIPLIMAFLMIYVCIERIQEITEGEEDDLSKY